MLQELLRLQALVEERPKDASTILQTELPKALSTALPTLQASSCLPVPCHLASAVPAAGSSQDIESLHRKCSSSAVCVELACITTAVHPEAHPLFCYSAFSL